MASKTFTVETRGQAVVIFGGHAGLTEKLTQDLLNEGVHSVKIKNLAELENLRSSYDPDYLVVFAYDQTATFFAGQGREMLPTMESLIKSGESRLIIVQNINDTEFSLPVSSIAKYIYVSDYVGSTDLSSDIIESWLKKIGLQNSLTIPGDGLEEVSLMGERDLSSLLVKAILHPNTKVGEEIYLGNPTPISLLNLAYIVRTNLPVKVNLDFDPDSTINLWTYNSKVLENSLEKLDYQLIDFPEELLKKYLKSHAETLPIQVPQEVKEKIHKVAPKIEEVEVNVEKEREDVPVVQQKPKPSEEKIVPIIKKLTPLKTNQPIFMPLGHGASRYKLSLANLKRHGSRPKKTQTILSRGIIIAIALYLGTLAFTATIAGLSLKQTITALHNGELPKTSQLNTFSTSYLRANWTALTSFPGVSKNQKVVDVNILFDAYSQSISTFETASQLSKSTQDLTYYIFGSGSSDVAKLVSLSRLQAEELYQKLSLLDGSLPAEPPALIAEKYQKEYIEAKAKLAKIKRSVTTTKAILATTPDIIGLGGRRKYAVLFQNNMELRATGGFIGSFAILSFENGKLYDMPIFDVYDADGQLKGHVEPPQPIKDILGEANWYLRDSNFDPDFPTSARRAEWFIKKSLNQDLNGTIAVNVNTLSSLLTATGPLTIPDYNETITEDNLYERAQFHAEVNFFPGSTQKKEFLSTVANALFTKLPALGAGDGLKLASALSDTIQEKNTLISLINPTTDHVFQTLNWNGQINDSPCPTSTNCHKDYTMIVDSNFGVNKANYFIKRAIEEVITFDKNLAVSHTLRINFQNTSTSTAWPAGAYRNFERLYLPIGTNIGNIKVGGIPLESKDYNVYSEHGKFVVAYLVTVPINSKTIVEIEYSTPQLTQENELVYTWYWQKQPGTSSDDSILVYINYPMYIRPTVVSPQSEVAPQQLKFSFVNDTDHRVTVKFQK